MPKPKNTAEVSSDIDIIRVNQTHAKFHVLGTSPLVLNRMSEKAKHELLMPAGRKTAVQKATMLKHIPIEEYRASAHRISDPNSATLLAIMATAFKGAMKTAALDLPGAKKAQIGRLLYVVGDYVGIYGVPQLFMAIVRSADMNKTPDVRTRAIVPQWAATITVSFVEPLIRTQAVANLLAAAGITAGVGDGRPEKGAMSYGTFKVVAQDDPEYLDIVKNGSRAAQEAAIQAPTAYDDESGELLSWFDTELQRRQLRGIA